MRSSSSSGGVVQSSRSSSSSGGVVQSSRSSSSSIQVCIVPCIIFQMSQNFVSKYCQSCGYNIYLWKYLSIL